MAKIQTNQAKQRPAGFNCPQCDFFIEVSIDSLLFGPDPKCAQCHTEFNMNRSDSNVALGFLQNLKVAADNIDSVNRG